LATDCHPRTMSYSTQGKTERNLVVSSSSSPASAASVPAFDPVDSKDDSPRRAVGRPSGNKGMLALHARPGHGVVGHRGTQDTAEAEVPV